MSEAAPRMESWSMQEEAPAPSDGELRFRILKRGDWRRAIKLEDVFWSALELAAARENAKLTDYVRAVLDAAPEGANQTAHLRVHAARVLRDGLANAERRLSETSAGEILKASPAPGFIVTSGLGLVGYNAAFARRMVEAARLVPGEPLPAARMSLEAPIDAIAAAIRKTRPKALECGFTLTIGASVLRGRIRACLALGPAGREDVLGFLVEA